MSEKVVIELIQVSSGCSGKIMLTYLSFCRIVEDPFASSLLARNTSYSPTASLSHQLLGYRTHDSSDEGSLTFIVTRLIVACHKACLRHCIRRYHRGRSRREQL